MHTMSKHTSFPDLRVLLHHPMLWGEMDGENHAFPRVKYTIGWESYHKILIILHHIGNGFSHQFPTVWENAIKNRKVFPI